MKRFLVCVIGLILLLFTFVLAHDTTKTDKTGKATKADKTVMTGADHQSVTTGHMPGSKDHVFMKADDLQWVDAPPGLPPSAQVAILSGDPAKNTVFTMRAKLPAGYRIRPHTHPADEHVTVVQGSFLMGLGGTFDENNMQEFPAGSFMVMAKGTQHFAMAREETIIQLHGQGPWDIIYVNPSDDPRKQSSATTR